MFSHLIPLTIATLRNRKGVTAAEYAILAVALVTAITAAMVTFGPAIKTKFDLILK